MLREAITASEMKAIDQNAAFWGMNPSQLMENAGAGVSEVIFAGLAQKSKLNSKKSKLSNATPVDSNFVSDSGFNFVSDPASQVPVLFFAGLGNNGGDTFVAARHLAGRSISSAVVLLGDESQIKTKESAQNYALLKKEKQVRLFEIKSESELEDFYETFVKKNDALRVIVDGIFGTGFSGTVHGLEKKAIEIINLQKAETPNIFVLSVDIPSGMDSLAGLGISDEKTIVIADATVTFHKMKTYLETADAVLFSGNVIVQPIGIPSPAEDYFGPGDLGNLYVRNAKSHKGDSGKVLVIGGGPYTGAPALSGMAALRTGADIVTVAVPAGAYEAVASYSPNLIVKKLSGNAVCDADIPFLSELIAAHDSVIMGPGIGTDPQTVAAVLKLLPLCRKVVLDADALQPEIMDAVQTLNRQKEREYDLILTPHRGEFIRIFSFLKIDPEKAESDLENTAIDVCSELGVTLLLKGPEDLIANGHHLRRNVTGNPAMSVGGTGDVLSGIVGGLFSKNNAFESAGCGAFICGCAGDSAFSEFGNSLLATDVIDEIADVFCFYDAKRQKRKNAGNEKSKNKEGKTKKKIETKTERKTKKKVKNGQKESKKEKKNESLNKESAGRKDNSDESKKSKNSVSEPDDGRKSKLMEIMKKIK
ncbi:NAD(P)H-hydrate dehydratase [Methanolapillus millepedarum]|uniref:Multifunctional fusion protein n=1 Tax=Methanolapillus millepedarum TaxID=3028296 RepID=A0AA96ZVB3_9EURY|nr:ATP-dependent (S)-NAD(P)H-hydrate dehydratase [Methanosarcinaceae archaeon Ac7]